VGALSLVRYPEAPARIARRREPESGGKPESHQQPRRRDDGQAQPGPQEGIGSRPRGHESRQPPEQTRDIYRYCHRPRAECHARVKTHAFRERAAESGGEDQAEQDDGKRAHRVTQIEAQPLQQAHFDQHEAESKQCKVERAAGHEPGPDLAQRRAERHHDRRRHQRDRDHQDHRQGERREEIAPHDARMPDVAQRRERPGEREEVEEERARVGGRAQVEITARGRPVERRAVLRAHQRGEAGRGGLGVGAHQYVEPELAAEALERGDLVARRLHFRKISGRNQLIGRVVALKFSGLLAQVTLAIGEQHITSIITADAAKELRLKPGDRAAALIKSTEVMILRV